MGVLYLLIFFSNLLCFLSQNISDTFHTITVSQSLSDGQTLVSQDGTFELGFFSPSNSKNRYIGIWYKKIPIKTVVWVANRDSPLNDTSGVLKIGFNGNLVLLSKIETITWSSNSSKAAENPVVELLESGNLVLRDGNSEIYLWESFNYPSDTLLPGMKLGWNLKTGLNRYLSAWKNFDDPSHGDLTYEIGLHGYPEAVMRKGSTEYYRSGPWNGLRYSGAPELKPNPVFRFSFVSNKDEVYYMYELNDNSVISRLVLNETSDGGTLQRLTWVDRVQNWVLHVSIPRDLCDHYNLCGAFSNCDMNDAPVCQCLKGFKPKSPQDWNATDWSQGCAHETPLDCKKGDGFVKLEGVKLPDTRHTWVNRSMNLEECKIECLKNCSCMGYTNSDISGGGSGCVIWLGNLTDIRLFSDAGQDLYIRMAASESDSNSSRHRNMKKRVTLIVTLTTVTMGMLFLACFIIWRKRKRKPKGNKEDDEDIDFMDESRRDELELPLFDLTTISASTNNFSEENKLGEGGFGPVYKGKLAEGQEIAVKRLSKKSVQGLDEFKNEVILISKLQHRNLVRLLGCCIQGEEKMLIYEYMPNKSLDSFIFDEEKSTLLDWQKRFHIVVGIARGLIYLHQDSRLRIIHRDLKASNILLDSDMYPKISDFGMARMFGGDQIEANTNRVVGTYGYMSPEYAIDGHFSVKSDVFSYGVLILEIVSGKKNRGFNHPDHQLNLLGHAWRLWSEDQAMQLVDESMRGSYLKPQVLRCIHVGLLCVQQRVEDRPTMSTVFLMLSSESVVLPQPQPPGFFIERSSMKANPFSSDQEYSYASNDVTVTLMEGR